MQKTSIDRCRKIKKRHLKQKVKASLEKYAPVVAAKKAYFTTVKALPNLPDLQNSPKGAGIKPVDGSTIFTMRYFEDGNLFDSSYEEIDDI
jgi:FKBP-type peptidyl-prolyl cis-trans isomerase